MASSVNMEAKVIPKSVNIHRPHKICKRFVYVIVAFIVIGVIIADDFEHPWYRNAIKFSLLNEIKKSITRLERIHY